MLATLLTELKTQSRALLNAQWRVLAGAAFVAVALAAIAYDEAVAPHFDRWSQIAADFARKVA
ncbi:MAG: hypothetical protein JNM59_09615 [Hyphomonadaceae bacterium]|nr:hypothetical protein [Hyphomonadaceae bacterium]